MEKLLSPQEMANLLGVNPSWVYRRTRMGTRAIPHIRVGRYVRFVPEEVFDFLKEPVKKKEFKR